MQAYEADTLCGPATTVQERLQHLLTQAVAVRNGTQVSTTCPLHGHVMHHAVQRSGSIHVQALLGCCDDTIMETLLESVISFSDPVCNSLGKLNAMASENKHLLVWPEATQRVRFFFGRGF